MSYFSTADNLLSIEDSVHLARVKRTLRAGRPLTIDQLRVTRSALAGHPEKLSEFEEVARENLQKRIDGGRQLPSKILATVSPLGLDEIYSATLRTARKGHGRSAAERMQAMRARKSSIPLIEVPGQQEIIDHIIEDPVWACWHYFPKWFYRPPSYLSETLIKSVWRVIIDGGNQSIGFVRGGGKSTVTKALMILAMCCGLLRYMVVFGSSGAKAKAIQKDILKQLQHNDLLLQDFPNVCLPIRAVQGVWQRAAYQTYQGEATELEVKTDYIRLANIPGFPASGSIIKTLGIRSGFLGLVEGDLRPDFVLCDDIQSLKDSKSDSAVHELEEATKQGIEGLASDRPLRIVQLATCVRVGDYPDRILDPDLYPEYSGLRLGLVNSWGTERALDHWENYCEIWRKDQREGDKRFERATSYYERHRSEMDAGVEVTDPSFYVDGLELSTVQHAWDMRLKMGDVGYFAQVENHPVSKSANLYTLTPKQVSESLNHLHRGEVPADALAVFAFSDVGYDKFRWAVAAVSPLQRVSIIDYGSYPQRGIIARKNMTDAQIQRAVSAAQAGLCKHLVSAGYSKRGGLPIRISVLGFDRGFRPDIIQKFCRDQGILYPFPLIPLRGRGESQWRPSGKNVIRTGYATQMVNGRDNIPGEYIEVRTDFLKEVVQRSFLSGQAGLPGSCSFWGDNPREHLEIADAVTAEVLEDKGQGVNGAEFWRWRVRPGGQNHYFDAIVGAYALACYYGFYAPSSDAGTADDIEERQRLAGNIAVQKARARRKVRRHVKFRSEEV